MNANIKSRQFCSVCKEWLDMEVVPTGDGDDDDGVIWFRCPQCQGFLPKLSGADLKPESEEEPRAEPAPAAEKPAADDDDAMPWDSPADMMKAMAAQDQAPSEPEILAEPATPAEDEDPLLGVEEAAAAGPALAGIGAGVAEDLVPEESEEAEDDDQAGEDQAEESGEPLLEYAAMLAEVDPAGAAPYRHWGTYEVGQCIHHLAWNDCGVVVAKEQLPGGRQVIKVYFEEAGVVRLIEQAPR